MCVRVSAYREFLTRLCKDKIVLERRGRWEQKKEEKGKEGGRKGGGKSYKLLELQGSKKLSNSISFFGK